MKILVADDDAVSRRVLQAMLAKWGYEVVAAADGAEAWHVLQGSDAPQLAILDWMMPNMDGPDVCKNVRGHPEIPYVYILLLTGRTLERDLIEGLEAGADDYLTKPFSTQELKVRLFSGKRILDFQAQLIAAREELRLLAIRDPLTGLFNRRYMEESLERELHRAARNDLSLAAIMIDLDHFKGFNDTWGHDAGDAVLREVGTLLKECGRGEDIACRYGGEEFTLILTSAGPEVACLRAEQFRQAPEAWTYSMAAGRLVASPFLPASPPFPNTGSPPPRSCGPPTKHSTKPRPEGETKSWSARVPQYTPPSLMGRPESSGSDHGWLLPAFWTVLSDPKIYNRVSKSTRVLTGDPVGPLPR
jgi:diguanylate cyclase (GGDEF)-like protein